MTTRPMAQPPPALLRFLISYLVVFAPLVPSALGAFGAPRDWYQRLWSGPAGALGRVLGFAPESLAVGSDRFQLALIGTFVLVALLATAIWTVSRPARRDDGRLLEWTRTLARYLLAYGTLHYAIVTLLRFELARLTPESLLTPPGEMRAVELLWIFLGWSPVFTTFLGGIELAAGLLLLRRQTATLGALIVGGILTNVVLLNLFFDVREKLLSPHFVLMTLILLAPDAQRLIVTHLSRRRVEPADLGRLELGSERTRAAIKTFAVVAMFASPLALIRSARGTLLEPKAHELAGLYRAIGANEPDQRDGSIRWANAVIGPAGRILHVQLANQTWIAYDIAIDSDGKRLVLSDPRPSEWREQGSAVLTSAVARDSLAIGRPKPNRLELRGRVAGREVRLELEAVDLEKRFNIFTGSNMFRRMQAALARDGSQKPFPRLKRPPP